MTAERERNWAGNHAYRARALHRPGSVAELQELVAATPRLRVLGSRHAFSDLADADELVSLDALPPAVVVEPGGRTVSCSAALRYGELAEALRPHGLALHNLASLPHISLAGAVATATHGSGDRHGNLATAVAGLELVTSSGELVALRRGDAGFDGAVVGLGALGAVTRLTLEVEPAYAVRQRVFEGLAWDVLEARFDELFASGDSVSGFTRWGDDVDQVWVKRRVVEGEDEDEDETVADELLGARPATLERHPILGLDPINCTPQLGAAGPWSERLPHFRMGFTPSNGDELQSEYLVPRRHALAAVDAMRRLAERVRPVLQVSELRTVAADALWLSPQEGEGTLGVHFTWHPRQAEVERVLVDVEAALAPFGARPHWGKLFVARADAVAPLYGRLADFRALAERLDPRGTFRNAWLERHVLGP